MSCLITQVHDKLNWKPTASKIFTVKSAYTEVSNLAHNTQSFDTWKLWWRLPAPSRLLTFGWRLFKESLPTKVLLKSRHLTQEDLCPLCTKGIENVLHVFHTCEVAQYLQTRLCKYLPRLSHVTSASQLFEELLRHHVRNRNPFKILSWLCLVEELWRARNLLIKKQKQVNFSLLTHRVC